LLLPRGFAGLQSGSALLGVEAVFLAGVAVNSSLMAGFALFTIETPHVLIAAYLFCFGVLRSAQMIGMGALAYSDVAPEEMSKATSIFALGRHILKSTRYDPQADFQPVALVAIATSVATLLMK
jgi:hypothetical protein